MSDIGINIPWPIAVIFLGAIFWQVPLSILMVAAAAAVVCRGWLRSGERDATLGRAELRVRLAVAISRRSGSGLWPVFGGVLLCRRVEVGPPRRGFTARERRRKRSRAERRLNGLAELVDKGGHVALSATRPADALRAKKFGAIRAGSSIDIKGRTAMNERRVRSRRGRPERMIGMVLLLCGLAGAMTACAQTTPVPAGDNINNPAVSPGALNNGVGIGPSEGVSTPPSRSP